MKHRNRHRGVPVGVLDRPDQPSLGRLLRDLGPVIYYAKVGGLIKIGFTSNLAVRFRNYPPGTKLLAWRTDATLEDEQEIHREMRHLLAAGNEWYWPTPEVLAIVNQARVDCGIAAAIA